jgi:hypothetical protein
MWCQWCGAVASTVGVCRSCKRNTPVAAFSSLAVAGLLSSICCGLVGLVISIAAIAECDRSGGRIKGRRLAIASVVIALVDLAVGLALATCWRHG